MRAKLNCENLLSCLTHKTTERIVLNPPLDKSKNDYETWE